MKIAVARGITYGVIGVAALVALQLTPPVVKEREPILSEITPSLPMIPLPFTRDSSGAAKPMFRAAPVIINAKRLTGTDTIVLRGTISSSLYEALDNIGDEEVPKGQRRSLAWRLAEIFEHRIDMSRDFMKGDKFNILVERLQQPNGKIIISKVLGAKLALSDEEFEAVHFKSKTSSGEWFDEKGKSLTASFLRAPLEFRRISSVFGRREHPILGTWRRHEGTDYAAARGTPVRAIGDGVVIAIGRNGGYGNVIDIRHRNGYVSRYGHLSSFAKSLKRGSRVTMGSTIGYVGSTGLATGPHLHFEIRVNGVARDPRVALRSKSGEPLSASERSLFNEIRRHTMAALAEPDSSSERLASADPR